jgi:hypothetical protein
MKNPGTPPFVLAWTIALLFYVLEYAARSSPAVMIPRLKNAYAISAVDVSGILGAYYYAYSVSSLVAGASIGLGLANQRRLRQRRIHLARDRVLLLRSREPDDGDLVLDGCFDFHLMFS